MDKCGFCSGFGTYIKFDLSEAKCPVCQGLVATPVIEDTAQLDDVVVVNIPAALEEEKVKKGAKKKEEPSESLKDNHSQPFSLAPEDDESIADDKPEKSK